MKFDDVKKLVIKNAGIKLFMEGKNYLLFREKRGQGVIEKLFIIIKGRVSVEDYRILMKAPLGDGYSTMSGKQRVGDFYVFDFHCVFKNEDGVEKRINELEAEKISVAKKYAEEVE